MAKAPKTPPTLTEVLRKALAKGPTLYSVTRETGVPKASLIRFLRSEQSLRLDIADKVAAHLKLVLVKQGK
jgi:hypothetical protein